jgi:hypothetical protein
MDQTLAIAQESMESRTSTAQTSVDAGKNTEFQALFLVPAEKIMDEWSKSYTNCNLLARIQPNSLSMILPYSEEFSERLLCSDFIQSVSEAEKLE